MHHIILTGCDKVADEVVAGVRASLHCVNPEAAFCRVSGGTGCGVGVPLDTVKSWVEVTKFHAPSAAALRLVESPGWDVT